MDRAQNRAQNENPTQKNTEEILPEGARSEGDSEVVGGTGFEPVTSTVSL